MAIFDPRDVGLPDSYYTADVYYSNGTSTSGTTWVQQGMPGDIINAPSPTATRWVQPGWWQTRPKFITDAPPRYEPVAPRVAAKPAPIPDADRPPRRKLKVAEIA